jgi:hypothetical protein
MDTPRTRPEEGAPERAEARPIEIRDPRVAVEPAADAGTPQRVAIDRAFLDRTELRRGLTDNLRTLQADAVAVNTRVTKAFDGWNPSGLSAPEVERRNFVTRDADLAEVQERVINRRVAAVTAAETTSRMTVRRNSRAGALVEGITDGTGTIKLGPLVQHIAERHDALVAPETTPATAVSVAEDEASKVIAMIDGAAPAPAGGKPAAGNGVATEVDVAQFVDRAVRRQLDQVSAPEQRPDFEPIPTGERPDRTQAQLLETFELRPGASDVTSYHDFTVLQIAFEHVWTQIFDGELESLGRQLYKEYVGLKDFLGYQAPDVSVTTIDDLHRLMAEITELSQIAQAQVPSSLGGTPGRTDTPKSSNDLENAAREVAAVATGGLSLLVELAIREFGRAGQKPVLAWNDVSGGVLNRGDRIKATIEEGVAAAGTVQLVLLTDGNSHKKEFAFQRYVEQAGRFVNVVFATNFLNDAQFVDGGQHLRGSATIQTSDLPLGMIEFASEETSAIALGRYVLGGLADRLKDKSRVTFYWTDN